MADLSAMYRATAASVPQPDEMILGALGMQRILNNGLQYQQERDNYEAMRGLRALFAKNPNPSMADVGAISPGFAQEYGKNQFAMQKDLLEMQKNRAEIGRVQGQVTEQDAKAWATIFGPIAERNMEGNPDQFKAEMADAIAQGQAQGLSLAPQFDINSLDPLSTLQRAQALGYRSQYLETQGAVRKEQQLRGLPPAPTPGQYYGEASIDPQSAMPMRTPPVVGHGAQPGPDAWQQNKPAPRNRFGRPMPKPGSLPETANAPTFDQVTDVKMLEEVYRQLPNGSPDKVAAGERLRALKEQEYDTDVGDTDANDRFASPGEVQNARVKAAGDKAAAEAQAKADVDRKEVAENKLTVLESIPPVEKIDSLIEKSISSGVEERFKNITSGEFGLQDDAVTATESLKTIEGQFKKLTRELAGAGAFSDSEQKMIKDATADVANPRVPVDARKAKMRFVMNMMENAVKKYPDLAQRLKPAQGGASSGIQPGHVEDGYRFKGGDPANPDNWEKQ